MQVQGTLTAVLALISFTTGVEANELQKTLGLDRQVGFVTRPDLVTLSYVKPIRRIVVPGEIAIPLQAVSEGLTFYVAYRARNYKAMAAVGAMSIWGGTLRRGINAVSGVNGLKKANKMGWPSFQGALSAFLFRRASRFPIWDAMRLTGNYRPKIPCCGTWQTETSFTLSIVITLRMKMRNWP